MGDSTSRRLVWGARGRGFKSRRPDQPFQSDTSDFRAISEIDVDDFVDVVFSRGFLRGFALGIPKKALSVSTILHERRCRSRVRAERRYLV